MRLPILLPLCLAGCAASVPDVPPAPPLASVTVIVPPPSTAAAAAVVKKFDKATVREPAVILGSDVTAEQIERVREADRRARHALQVLGRQGRHQTKAALSEARDAVKALEDALSQ